MNPEQSPQRRVLHRAVRRLMRYFKTVLPIPDERRRHRRVHFVHPITVTTADQRTLHCLSRDLSLEGMRLLGSQSLIGQTVHIVVPHIELAQESWRFTLQVLWSSQAGDGLIDIGGRLLDAVDSAAADE